MAKRELSYFRPVTSRDFRAQDAGEMAGNRGGIGAGVTPFQGMTVLVAAAVANMLALARLTRATGLRKRRRFSAIA